MAVFSKVILSGVTDGRPVAIAATATPGTLVHTADAVATDEVWLYAVNTGGATRTLTIEYGGVVAGDLITRQLAVGAGLVLIVPGLVLTNSLVVRAFADAAGVNIVGWVNRIA
jgi:uncharacterized membrane protein YjjP (DUF1212 family)